MNPEIPIESFEIFADGMDHPEGLAFDQEGYLWAGGEAGQVYRIDPGGKVEEVTNLGGFCGGLAFSPENELFLCNAHLGVVHVKPSGENSILADHAGDHRIVCPNYPVFDSRGNLYISDSGDWKKNNGYLLLFDSDGKGQILGGPYGYANGLALSSDEEYLFMVESDSARVYQFEILSDGTLGAQKVYAEQVGRVPDGLAFDCEGNLYVCCYASDDIYRITPSQEKRLFAFDPNGMLLGRPTNMAFGGEEFSQLYVANLGRYAITRARVDRSGQLLANQKSKNKEDP